LDGIENWCIIFLTRVRRRVN